MQRHSGVRPVQAAPFSDKGDRFVSLVRSVAHTGLALALSLILLGTVGCALAGGTLGGREKCWPEDPPRGASIWRGILRIDSRGGRLDTSEGDVIPLIPGTLTTRVGGGGAGELVRGNDVVARAGADLTLFGGMGSDGGLVVCGVEEIHSP
jgi:hypothetical protein